MEEEARGREEKVREVAEGERGMEVRETEGSNNRRHLRVSVTLSVSVRVGDRKSVV